MIFVNENENKDKIGIYMIKNLINNEINIGQTQDRFIERYWNHKWKLNNKTHDNKHLQRSWDKYGEDAFEFRSIHELAPNENIDDLERYYINLYSQNNILYNIQEGGRDTTMKNIKMSEETKRKIGEKNKQNMLGRKASQETKQKMSQTRKNKTPWGSCKLSPAEAEFIKKELMKGKRPVDISDEYNIEYKVVNNIFSSNTYKSVYVEGWDEFYKNRPDYSHDKKSKLRKLTDQQIKEIQEMKKERIPEKEIMKKYGISRSTIYTYTK